MSTPPQSGERREPASASASPLDPLACAHRAAVDERLQQASRDGVRRWAELLVAAEGADPTMVADRVRALGLPVEGGWPPPMPDPTDGWRPELHALDFEWYFERQCAVSLATRLTVRDDSSVLCLGTPTVAFALLDRPHPGRVTLVDRNPLVRDRDRRAEQLETIVEDLAAARVDAGRYDAAVFDAPWYPEALRHWLWVAARAVKPGGTILFALPRALHRPSAASDRETMLGHARRLGTVAIEPGALRYESPRFEREAMATAGVAVPHGWRRADLVELSLRSPERLAGSVPTATDGSRWRRFVIGEQVVHLDLQAPDEPGELLVPVDARPDFRYGSISTRDPRRAEIGLWTSRSRVARVRRPAIVAAVLEQLARGTQAEQACEHEADPEHRARLGAALRAIIG